MKNSQLQIRISEDNKRYLSALAKTAGMSLSDYVLSKVLSAENKYFQSLVLSLGSPASFAELNDFLVSLERGTFRAAVQSCDWSSLDTVTANTLAAMVEERAAQLGLEAPSWVTSIKPLDEPFFGTSILSLRLYLLTNSPLPYRLRNIFIDSGLGARV